MTSRVAFVSSLSRLRHDQRTEFMNDLAVNARHELTLAGLMVVE
jgi:hypothetical protein